MQFAPELTIGSRSPIEESRTAAQWSYFSALGPAAFATSNLTLLANANSYLWRLKMAEITGLVLGSLAIPQVLLQAQALFQVREQKKRHVERIQVSRSLR